MFQIPNKIDISTSAFKPEDMQHYKKNLLQSDLSLQSMATTSTPAEDQQSVATTFTSNEDQQSLATTSTAAEGQQSVAPTFTTTEDQQRTIVILKKDDRKAYFHRNSGFSQNRTEEPKRDKMLEDYF